MSLSLAGFQDAFIQTLYGSAHEQLSALTTQPGLMIYRNNVMTAARDALLANYPTVERLTGTPWLQAVATDYARQSQPDTPLLLEYSEGFAAFLDTFEPDYLGNVARLDRYWMETHTAIDEPSLDLSLLIGLDAAQLASLHLRPKAASRWHWFDGQPAYTLWRCNREQVDVPDNLDWRSEGVLVLRTGMHVTWQALDQACCRFLDACATGVNLAQALEYALQVQPDLAPQSMLSRLLSAAVFTSLPSPLASRENHAHS